PPPLPALRLLPSPPHPPDLPSFPTRRSSDLPRRSTRWRTSTLTTAGPTFSATAVTTREYASSSSPSDAAAGRAAESAAPVQASDTSVIPELMCHLQGQGAVTAPTPAKTPPGSRSFVYLTCHGPCGLSRSRHRGDRRHRPRDRDDARRCGRPGGDLRPERNERAPHRR